MAAENKGLKPSVGKTAVPAPKAATPAKVVSVPEDLEEKLHKELVELARKPGQEELQQRLKQLVVEKTISKTALLGFLNRTLKKDKTLVVLAVSINIVGVLLCKEADPALKKLGAELYKLAADRENGNGAKNFAQVLFYGQYGFEKNLDEALKYAGLALAKNISETHFIRAEILGKKGNHAEAIQSYLKIAKPKKGEANKQWDNAKKSVDEIADFFLNRIKSNQTDTAVLNEVLTQAQSLLKFGDPQLKNKCYYIIGLTYYYIGSYEDAMLSFVEIPEADVHYRLATPIKRDCYLRTAEAILNMQDGASATSAVVVAHKGRGSAGEEKDDVAGEKKGDEPVPAPPEDSQVISLLDGTTGKLSFSKAWKKDENRPSYDVVNIPLLEQIKDAWQQMLDSTSKMLEAKREAVVQGLKYKKNGLIPTLEGLQQSKKKLEAAEQACSLQQIALEKTAAAHMPAARRRWRRAKAEARYFDPTKAKPAEKKEVFGLYQEILAARLGEPVVSDAKDALSLTPLSAASLSLSSSTETKRTAKQEGKAAPSVVSKSEDAAATPSPSPATVVAGQASKVEEKKKEKGVITLNGHNARRVYRAERLFQQAGVQLLNSATVGRYAMRLGIPHDSTLIKGSAGYDDGGAGSSESWQAGEHKTSIVHAITPSRQRLGNIYLPEHGDYDMFLGYLNQIAEGDTAKEKTLVNYMIRYACTFTPTTAEEIRGINTNATEKQAREMAEQFHAVCLLVTVKEQTQWLSSEDQEYQTGLAVAQARCLILLREGYLTFSDVFKKGATFGVFSQVNLLKEFEKVEAAIEKIEEVYIGYIKFSKCKESASFFAKNRNYEMVLTRQQARLDLREIYGGEESGSEDEGYASDISYDGAP
jgi:hypothetical protein